MMSFSSGWIWFVFHLLFMSFSSLYVKEQWNGKQQKSRVLKTLWLKKKIFFFVFLWIEMRTCRTSTYEKLKAKRKKNYIVKNISWNRENDVWTESESHDKIKWSCNIELSIQFIYV